MGPKEACRLTGTLSSFLSNTTKAFGPVVMRLRRVSFGAALIEATVKFGTCDTSMVRTDAPHPVMQPMMKSRVNEIRMTYRSWFISAGVTIARAVTALVT